MLDKLGSSGNSGSCVLYTGAQFSSFSVHKSISQALKYGTTECTTAKAASFVVEGMKVWVSPVEVKTGALSTRFLCVLTQTMIDNDEECLFVPVGRKETLDTVYSPDKENKVVWLNGDVCAMASMQDALLKLISEARSA